MLLLEYIYCYSAAYFSGFFTAIVLMLLIRKKKELDEITSGF